MNRFLLFATVCASVACHGQSVDVRVDGPGLLRFVRDGKMVYAKSAKLTVVEGRLADASGAKLAPAVCVGTVSGLSIDLEGVVSTNGSRVGRIVLAVFEKEPTGTGLLTSPERPTLSNPGEGTVGVLRTGLPKLQAHSDKPPVGHKAAASLGTDKPKGRVTVTVPDVATVEGDSFSLGQIAVVTGDDALQAKLLAIELGDTPPLGIDRIVPRSRILAKLAPVGVDPDKATVIVPERVRVQRKGQSLTDSQFVEAAVRGAEVKGLRQLEQIAPMPPMTAPLGDVQLVCESVSGQNGEYSAMVGVYVDGKRFNGRLVRLKSTAPTVNLRPGTIVKVRVWSGRVSVDTTGKVQKVDASSGQVTVQVTGTGALLTGTVQPDGTIEVKA